MTRCVPPPLPGEGHCELAEPKHLNRTDANEARPGLWCVAVTLGDVCDRDALLALRVDGMLRISVIRERVSTSQGRCLLAFVTAFVGTSAKALHSESATQRWSIFQPSRCRPQGGCMLSLFGFDVAAAVAHVDTYSVNAADVVAVFGDAFNVKQTSSPNKI